MSAVLPGDMRVISWPSALVSSGRSTDLAHENATPRLSRTRCTARRSMPGTVRSAKPWGASLLESTTSSAPVIALTASKSGCRSALIALEPLLAHRRVRRGRDQLAVAVGLPRGGDRLGGVEPVPAAESLLPHLTPERAVVELLPARAQRVVAKAALPEVAHLADRDHARHSGEQHVEHGRAAAPETTDEEHPHGHRAGAAIWKTGGSISSGSASTAAAWAWKRRSRQRSAQAIITT